LHPFRKEKAMQYTYEFEVFESEGWFIACPFDMSGATQGKTMEETSLMAADWLRTDIEHRLMHGVDIPTATFGNTPEEGGVIMVVSVDVELGRVPRVSASEAARILGVSPARVTHMIRDGLLEAFRDGHRTYVTRSSLEARLAAPRSSGRPRKAVATQA
jgi:predicted RNase H-like HicB family nuclease